jgi:CheY-like chemotaxis protein
MEKKKILVVDDEESITTVFKLLIENSGKYEVLTETKGSRAIAAAKQFKPDLVLLDIMMPDLDGGEVARKMKADKDTKDIPIVFVSAAVTKEEAKKQGTIQGGYPIVAKPVSEEELIETIEKYIDKKKRPNGAESAPSPSEQKGMPSTDRRNHKRVQTGSILSYVCLDENNTPLEEGVGNALNISQGGLLLGTTEPIETEHIQLTIRGIKDELITVKGKVIYSQMKEPDVYHTGINFRESSEKTREFIVKLIKLFSLRKNR